MKKYNIVFVSICSLVLSGIILASSVWADDLETAAIAATSDATQTVDFAQTSGIAPANSDSAAQTSFKTKIYNQKEVNRFKTNKPQFVQDEIVVKFKGNKEHFRVIKVPQGQVSDKVKEYQNMADVESVAPNYIAYALTAPADPYYRFQWNLDTPTNGGIHMENAWNISTGNSSVIVAVVDTGIAYENNGAFCQAPDLSQTNFVPGWDFVNNTAHANDDDGHGTHVAGTLAQSTNNGQGLAGIAFNTTLMPVKVLDSTGSGSYTNVANGIYYAADHGAKVINLSLGGSAPDTTLEDAVKYAYNKGVTVVAACGNEGAGSCLYPAAYDNYVISVGATRFDQTKTGYSNYGPNLDVMAPGGDMTVDQNGDGYNDGIFQETFNGPANTCNNFGYWLFSGTSMATPHVAGTAALLLANGNATTPDQIKTALETTALDLGSAGRDDNYGWGLIDAAKALAWKNNPNPVCSSNSSCDDGNACTTDFCINPGTATASCAYANAADNTKCGTAGICCAGKCSAPACTANSNCNDGNSCTTDVCQNAGKCAAKCAAAAITRCGSGDGCCPASCNHSNDGDCAAIKCWSGSNQYLYFASAQFSKFCKCAQGTYGYNSYKNIVGKKTIWKYSDMSNNFNWAVTSTAASNPVYSVTCSDRKAYPTNQNYFR